MAWEASYYRCYFGLVDGGETRNGFEILLPGATLPANAQLYAEAMGDLLITALAVKVEKVSVSQALGPDGTTTLVESASGDSDIEQKGVFGFRAAPNLLDIQPYSYLEIPTLDPLAVDTGSPAKTVCEQSGKSSKIDVTQLNVAAFITALRAPAVPDPATVYACNENNLHYKTLVDAYKYHREGDPKSASARRG